MEFRISRRQVSRRRLFGVHAQVSLVYMRHLPSVFVGGSPYMCKRTPEHHNRTFALELFIKDIGRLQCYR